MAVMRDHRTISIADQIFEQLERDILTGKYARGEVLNEQKLTAELGVSRTPVREAMRRSGYGNPNPGSFSRSLPSAPG